MACAATSPACWSVRSTPPRPRSARSSRPLAAIRSFSRGSSGMSTIPARMLGWCNELLRLWPHNPFLLRQTETDVTLDGAAIPAGATVIAYTHAAMFDPSRFPDPGRSGPDPRAQALPAFRRRPASLLGPRRERRADSGAGTAASSSAASHRPTGRASTGPSSMKSLFRLAGGHREPRIRHRHSGHSGRSHRGGECDLGIESAAVPNR